MLKNIIIAITAFALFSGALVWHLIFGSHNAAHAATIDIDSAIGLAMDYVDGAVEPSGRFVYVKYLKPAQYDKKEYNVSRHAGMLYSMYLCEKYLKNDRLKEKRLKASQYLIDNYIKRIPKLETTGKKPTTIYAVVSIPEEEGLKTVQAKVGATGLALVALSNLYPEGKVDIEQLRGLANFVIYMQKPDGSLYVKYDLTKKKVNESPNSIHYPGECALGLLYLYEVDPQKTWLNSAKKSLLYLANGAKDSGTKIPFDYRAMLAIQKLFETPNNGLSKKEKTLLQSYAAQTANSILPRLIKDRRSPDVGGYKNNLRPSSIGTIIEGMVAIFNVTEDEELKAKVMQAIYLSSEFESRHQIKTGKLKGGIPTGIDWQSKTAKPEAARVQIDNVQHVMSGWITYKQLFK